MANTAYQVSNFSYQADGAFAYQGASGGAVPVPPPPPAVGNLNWLKKKRRKKRVIVPDVSRETIVVELPPQGLPISSLRQVLDEMESAGFDFVESEEEDMLLLTFVLKKLN